MYKIKTVDVWDTFLRRKCHPDFIKLATARYFYYKYFSLHKNTDQQELFKQRVKVERSIGELSVKNGFDDEYLFENVINQWVKLYLTDFSSSEIATIANELCEFEFSLELKLTEPDKDIKNFLDNYPAEKTYFLSDFYMDKNRLSKLLNKNGLSSFYNDGFSSADIKLNKRSGNIFKFINKELSVDYNDWVHIGDNEWSDKIKPSELGIECIRYLPEHGHQQRIITEGFFSNSDNLIFHILKKAEFQLNEQNDKDESFLLGVRSSPFILGYSLFILEKAIESGSEEVYFFTREGEFFSQIFSKLIGMLEREMPAVVFPKFQLLEVSRIATFCASLQNVSTKEMMRLWNLYSSQSFSALLKTLDLEESKYKVFSDKHSIPIQEVIRFPWKDNRVISLFNDEEFKQNLLNDIQSKKNLLLGYLSSKGLSDSDRNVCVVDVGWRGTIQDNIALLLPQVKFTGVYLGLAKFLNPQPENSKKYAYGPNLNIEQKLPHFLDSVAPIEMITNSPSGSVVGYELIDGNYSAIRKVDEGENLAWHSFTAKLQQGMMASMSVWTEYLVSHSFTSNNFRPLAMKIWASFIEGESDELNKTFSTLNHNETFGLGEYVEKNSTPSVKDILQAPFNWRKRRTLIDFIIANQWSDGIRKRKELTYFHRNLLASVIDVAVFYKRRFHRR